jgi:hypothetical protein
MSGGKEMEEESAYLDRPVQEKTFRQQTSDAEQHLDITQVTLYRVYDVWELDFDCDV